MRLHKESNRKRDIPATTAAKCGEKVFEQVLYRTQDDTRLPIGKAVAQVCCDFY